MRSIYVSATAATDGIPVLIDRDTELTYAILGGLVVVSTSPAATIANTATAAPGGQVNHLIAFCGSAASGVFSSQIIKFPLTKGETVYVSVGTANRGAHLFFTDPDS